MPLPAFAPVFPHGSSGCAGRVSHAADRGASVLLIASRARAEVFAGYALGGDLMLAAAIVAAFFVVKAERRSLESSPRRLPCAPIRDGVSPLLAG